jgi:hypothetical protein
MREIVFVPVLAFVAQAVAGQPSYVVSPAPMSWQDARDWAESVGGHLVCLSSAQEEVAVAQIVGPNREYWLGFTDEMIEGEWRWITGEPVLYTRWQPGEPNEGSSSPTGEDYAMAWTYGGYGWWDYPSPLYGVDNPQPVLAYAVAEFPPPAEPDRNGDGLENGQDLAIVLGFWGQCAAITCLGDTNFDGVVDGKDLGIVLGAWTG